MALKWRHSYVTHMINYFDFDVSSVIHFLPKLIFSLFGDPRMGHVTLGIHGWANGPCIQSQNKIQSYSNHSRLVLNQNFWFITIFLSISVACCHFRENINWARNTKPVGGDVNKAVDSESLTFQLYPMFLQTDQYLDCLHSWSHIFHA